MNLIAFAERELDLVMVAEDGEAFAFLPGFWSLTVR
jgi:hypothetical protein